MRTTALAALAAMTILLLVRGAVASASSLETREIDGTVHARIDDIRACYEEGLKRKPRLAGKLVMKFKVERDGSVHEAGLTKSTLRDERVESCLVGVFETMQFPAFGPPCADGEDCSIRITYPLHFEPEK